MIGRLLCGVCMVALGASLGARVAAAQDVPGIEICTVEKTMERRTSCLQSNVEFLQKTIAKQALDHQQKLDAANRQIEALKANVVTLQKSVDDLKAVQAKAPDSAKKGDTTPPKDTAAKDAPKDGAKDAAKEGGK
jgi:TolA-binding protein